MQNDAIIAPFQYESMQQDPIRILLVEDSIDDLELIIFQLEANGLEFEYAQVMDQEGLRDALLHQEWDIVLSDYYLPGFDGIRVLKTVREFDPFLPFILISGLVGEQVALELMRNGAQDYIEKSNLARLETVIRRELIDSKIKREAVANSAALQKVNKRLSTIYNGTNDGMVLFKVTENAFIMETVNRPCVLFNQSIGIDLSAEDYEGILLRFHMFKNLGYEEAGIEHIFKKFEKVKNTGKRLNCIEQVKHGNKINYFDVRLIPIKEGGVCTHILWIARDITESTRNANKLRESISELKMLKAALLDDNQVLRNKFQPNANMDFLIHTSQCIEDIIVKIKQVAPFDTGVLITGETGTGKELIAQGIHNMSPRAKKKMITINCGAIPHELIESELFGHEKGAFTGANDQKPGKFELANHSTIFLDEIGEMPLSSQVKLLRVLQEGEIYRVGGVKPIKLDVRVIAATNRNLKQEIREGNFREDLYYRLNIFPIYIPPLRERPEDIQPLVQFFTPKYARKYLKEIDAIPESVWDKLNAYPWPGNIRELENLVERAVILSQDKSFPIEQLLPRTPNPSKEREEDIDITALHEVERNHILKMLERTDWKINGTQGAAELLKLNPTTLRDRMKKHGIQRPPKS